ncbi:MAG: hypothetical protein ACR2Q3_14855 [Woeseiaceae bacterium]
MGNYTAEIIRNAERINQLKKRIDDTLKHRDKSDHNRREWEEACAEFHAQYDALAFPGGIAGAYDRILSGQSGAVEAALCFLECRPYFFRSGYMFKDILRKTKRAPLNPTQQARLDAVIVAYEKYRDSRKQT